MATELAQVHRAAEHRQLGSEIDQFHIVERNGAKTAIRTVGDSDPVRAEHQRVIALIPGKDRRVDTVQTVDTADLGCGDQRIIIFRSALKDTGGTRLL